MAGGGSALKRLKSSLKEHDLLQPQSKRKKKTATYKERRERDLKVLESIRTAFKPFSIKTAKQKFPDAGSDSVLQAGKPAASKQANEIMRKQAYAAKNSLKGRVGGIVDRRFGEKDKSVSTEDKMVERFTRERMLAASKEFIFNLEDEDTETLTHGGAALSTLNFEDDNFEHEAANMRATGIATGSNAEPRKTKKEIMREIIAKSKQYKEERQREKLEDKEQIASLNSKSNFSELMTELAQYQKGENDTTEAAEDEYDMRVREMIFDRRARPDDRTKTEEELRQEAAERRKAQECEREDRMASDFELEDEEAYISDDARRFGLDTQLDAGSRRDSEKQSSDSEASIGAASVKPQEVEQRCEQALKLPSTAEELATVLEPDEQDRFAKLLETYHPSRGEENKKHTEKILVTMCELASKSTNSSQFRLRVSLIQHEIEKYNAAISDYFNRTIDGIQARISKNEELGLPDLLTFAMVGQLFSTSDQRHPVASPAQLAMAQHLSQNVSMSPASVARRLFLCDLLLVYQRISKRYIPEVPCTLMRVFSAIDGVPSAKRFVRVNASSRIILGKQFQNVAASELSLSNWDTLNASRMVIHAVGIVDKIAALWRSCDAYPEIIGHLLEQMRALPENKFVRDVCSKVERTLRFALAERRPLMLQDHRPIPLASKVPQFEENFNPLVKSYDQDAQQVEISRLKKIFKRERKETLKEIRRDAAFESRQRLAENTARAKEYHQMLSKITNRINTEEGAERNRYEREKRRRRA